MFQNIYHARLAGAAPWTDVHTDLCDLHVSVFRDAYPVTHGHLLFVPNFNSAHMIAVAVESAVLEGNRMVERGECDGYNVGLNSGEAAGQTVMYPHVHLIPRRTGDMPDPTGGVRHVIPEKGNYKKGKVDENSSTTR